MGRFSLGRPQIQHFDEQRECHCEINVAARNVRVESLGDKDDADEQQERQGEHFHARVTIDERRNWPAEDYHYGDRQQDGANHDR